METMFIVAWLLKVDVCLNAGTPKARCKTIIERPIGSQWACENRAAHILFLVPSSPPSLFGFATAKPVHVTTTCSRIAQPFTGV